MRTVVSVVTAFAACATLAAQTRFTYSSGQTVSPAYEGWMYAPDGSVLMSGAYIQPS